MATTWTSPAVGSGIADHLRVSEAGCTSGTEALPAYQGVWAAGTNYAASVLVTRNNEVWLSLQANNLGNVPGPNSAWWSKAVGLDLKNLADVIVSVELPAGNIGAGASLYAYLQNPSTGVLARAPSLDIALTAGIAAQSELLTRLVNKIPPVGRIIYLPNAVGAACNVFLNGIPMSGISQS